MRFHDLPELRPGQAQVLHALLSGRRTLFVAPTGHGKSLCYQALAASPWTRGLVLVFQPLKALMKEQVTRTEAVGLRAALIDSDLDPEEQRRVLVDAVEGRLDVLFISPERQGNHLWLEHIGKLEIKGVVIDEAHCISQWGHDFRPWYRRLVETIMGLGVRTPVLGLTATAPTSVVEDIVEQIGPDNEHVAVIRLPSYRPNLSLGCVTAIGLTARLGAVLSLVQRYQPSAGIVYFLTKDETMIAASLLRAQGVHAAAYHGGMEAADRSAVLRQWYSGEHRIVCATSALGMGIDRPDVRLIIHCCLPDSLLRYVQEIGRAGRDGSTAHIVAIHDPDAAPLYVALARGCLPAPKDYQAIAEALRSGERTRTEVIRETDVPQATTQYILDDLGARELCTQQGQPRRYHWCGGDASAEPPRLREAIERRQILTRQALTYAESCGCRAHALARAMDDDESLIECGACDRCLPQQWAAPEDLGDLAREHLAGYCPPIKKKLHAAGLCLSRYGLGPTGEAVKAAKYLLAPLPLDVVELACAKLSATDGPFAGIRIDAVVAVPSTTSSVVRDFAAALASRLRVPWHELVKARSTAPQKRFRSRENKRLNIAGAFKPLPLGAAIHVLVVDDVLDSGETLQAAATALRPMRVHPLVLAMSKHQDDQ